MTFDLCRVDEGNDLALETKFRTILFANGIKWWVPGVKFATTCPVDLTYFPFDLQTCRIKVTNWSFRDSMVNFTLTENTIMMDLFQPNGEWDIVSTHAQREVLIYQSNETDAPPVVCFSITMRRKPQFYVLNIIIPCVIRVLTIVAALLVCTCAAWAGEAQDVLAALSGEEYAVTQIGEVGPGEKKVTLI